MVIFHSYVSLPEGIVFVEKNHLFAHCQAHSRPWHGLPRHVRSPETADQVGFFGAWPC